jgi:O-antigen ligase
MALMVLYLVSAYTTLNRTIWLAFVVQVLLVALLLSSRPSFSRQSARPYAILSAVMVVALAAVAASAFVHVQEQRRVAFEQDTRLALWPVIVEHIEQRPLTGYGFGRGLLREILGAQLSQLDPHLWHAHNYFLESLIQTGVPGLLLVLLLVAATLREGRRLAHAPDDAAAACGIALVGVVAGMLVRNMTDTLFVRQSALFYWALVGALLGAGMALRSRRPCNSSAVDPGGRYSGIQRRN